MKFTAEHYCHAALERIEQAKLLYSHGKSYAAAMYLGGVAVESLLRAFRLRKDPTFDERHDLAQLFKASGILTIDSDLLEAKGLTPNQITAYVRELHTAVTTVYLLWSNDYRYAGEDRLRAHVKTLKLTWRDKGDQLKSGAFRMLNAAQRFVDKGAILWVLSVKS
jgi:hypothetical protein